MIYLSPWLSLRIRIIHHATARCRGLNPWPERLTPLVTNQTHQKNVSRTLRGSRLLSFDPTTMRHKSKTHKSMCRALGALGLISFDQKTHSTWTKTNKNPWPSLEAHGLFFIRQEKRTNQEPSPCGSRLILVRPTSTRPKLKTTLDALLIPCTCQTQTIINNTRVPSLCGSRLVVVRPTITHDTQPFLFPHRFNDLTHVIFI